MSNDLWKHPKNFYFFLGGEGGAASPKDDLSIGEEVPQSTLQLVEIFFDTSTFDDIERDKKIKTEAQLSLIGGTMGLLTGFSIISGVKIIFFLFRLIANIGNVSNSIFRLICSLRITGLLWQKMKDFFKTIECKICAK